MKSTQILEAVREAIEQRPQEGRKTWYLTWKDNCIVAVPTNHTPKPEIVFRSFTDWQAEHGFESKEWSSVLGTIYDFLEQKGLL